MDRPMDLWLSRLRLGSARFRTTYPRSSPLLGRDLWTQSLKPSPLVLDRFSSRGRDLFLEVDDVKAEISFLLFLEMFDIPEMEGSFYNFNMPGKIAQIILFGNFTRKYAGILRIYSTVFYSGFY